jgi:putative addiction module antidote
MHFSLKIIQIGNSLGVTLPKEALAALKVEKGDTLTLTPAPDGFRSRSKPGGRSCANTVTRCARWRNERACLASSRRS